MNNRRPEATRDEFAATPLTVSRKQMFIPVHAKRGGFAAPVSAPARKQPLRGASTRFRARVDEAECQCRTKNEGCVALVSGRWFPFPSSFSPAPPHPPCYLFPALTRKDGNPRL